MAAANATSSYKGLIMGARGMFVVLSLGIYREIGIVLALQTGIPVSGSGLVSNEPNSQSAMAAGFWNTAPMELKI